MAHNDNINIDFVRNKSKTWIIEEENLINIFTEQTKFEDNGSGQLIIKTLGRNVKMKGTYDVRGS
ncbi:3079_t:CDS:2 [Cetraspora pellucida]|uniref:3079_t:CDS:1 n=1 Tax=Cetraspora pellucida TaxID=1433469 RepID=A0A9N9G3B0_9GLOM|nr:3079_t:CDS:2 [Cetraspora pellucida]